MRRAALGMIRIILENNIRLRLQNVVASQIAKISSENQRRAKVGLLTNTLGAMTAGQISKQTEDRFVTEAMIAAQ